MPQILDMRRDGQKANFFPMRWFIAEMITANPQTIVIRDSQHLSGQYSKGVASGILTSLTGGRCFVVRHFWARFSPF